MSESSGTDAQPRGILFLCVANSARSQMAEGLAQALLPNEIAVASAGSQPGRVDPRAIQVLTEIGIDIGHHHSKRVDDVALEDFDHIVTLCAEAVCPVAIGTFHREHWPLPDPVAATEGPDDLEPFRRVRDRLRELILERYSH